MSAAEHDKPGATMEVRMVDVGGQPLRAGIQRGELGTTPLLIFNGVGANLGPVEPFARAMRGVEIVIFDVPGVSGSPVSVLPYRFWQLAGLAEWLLQRLGYSGEADVLGVSWGGALAQQFACRFPSRCRRLVLAATSAGVVMVPGRLSVLMKMVSSRRYRDPKFLDSVGGELHGGVYRRDRALLREHGRHIRPRPAAATFTSCSPAGAGPASRGWAACASRRW
jgi:pimeloyl-ACP methyl ester carboxylesterase